jgi:hypothetical protein
MRVFNINQFTKGWIVGNFNPSVFKSEEIEVAHHFHKRGFVSELHYHTKSEELSYIVTGKAYVDDNIIEAGCGWVYEAYECSNVIFLEDTNLIVIRTPSVNDKVIIYPEIKK